MIENDLIITVLGEMQLGSAGHAPANVGVICSGIHVSCPVNGGGTRSNPRERLCSEHKNIAQLRGKRRMKSRWCFSLSIYPPVPLSPSHTLYSNITVSRWNGGGRTEDEGPEETKIRGWEVFEVDRGWDSWDSDRRLKGVAVVQGTVYYYPRRIVVVVMGRRGGRRRRRTV